MAGLPGGVLRQKDRFHFHVGAGIVSDSVAEAEYEETLAKAGGFFAALALTASPPQLRSTTAHAVLSRAT